MPQAVKHPRSLASYLKDDSSHLSSLYEHIEYLAGLEKKLQVYLSEPVQKHFKIANYSNNTLVLHADSAVWATRLRYYTPKILQFMQKECGLSCLKTIRIKVKVPDRKPEQRSRANKTLSVSTSDFIRQVANSITDKDLRKSLHKIAKHYHDV